ncbi:hypothetical protein [Nostoc sp. JL31]|uniref:hypothetical protein n=1 Tax=Nostoc sp. JL31 TaxID=2815395 RepID=UPI0025F7CEE9|nr:hypothetical protein [Nostoc sp. JL31]
MIQLILHKHQLPLIVVDTETNGTKKSPKTYSILVPSLEAGNEFREALPLVKLWRRSLREWFPSLEAGNQLGQGLYLNLVPFDTETEEITQWIN